MTSFDELQRELDKLEEDYRLARADINHKREEIAIEMLHKGYTVKRINSLAGTTNPNWVYTACEKRGLPTPGQIRASAQAAQEEGSLTVTEVKGGYSVTSNDGEEYATFTWLVEAGAYSVSRHKVKPGGRLAEVVRAYGKGLLPFPYPHANPKEA